MKRAQIFPYVIAVLLAGALALGVGAAWAAMEGEEESLETSVMQPRGELPTRAEAPGTASLLRLGVGLAIVLTLLFGLLARTERGRVLNDDGWAHLAIKPPLKKSDSKIGFLGD